MVFFSKLHEKYQHFVLSKIPKPLHHLRFLVILLVILSVPVTLVLLNNSQDIRQRASEGTNSLLTGNNPLSTPGPIASPPPPDLNPMATPIVLGCNGDEGCYCYSDKDCNYNSCYKKTPDTSTSISMGICKTNSPTPSIDPPFIVQISYPACKDSNCSLSNAVCSWFPSKNAANYTVKISDLYSGGIIAIAKVENTSFTQTFSVSLGHTYECIVSSTDTNGKTIESSLSNLLIKSDDIKPSCTPRPACLDTEPRCMITMSEGVTWCPPTITPAPPDVNCNTESGKSNTCSCSSDTQCLSNYCNTQGTTASIPPTLFGYCDSKAPTNPKPTIVVDATPTPSYCKTGLNSFSVETPCDDGYRFMRYSCYDGRADLEGGTSSCKPKELWYQYAQERCNGRSSCDSKLTSTPAAPSPKTYKCDFNSDKSLDILDYTIWLKQFQTGGKPQSPSADCNSNGTVDIYDYNLWLRELKGLY